MGSDEPGDLRPERLDAPAAIRIRRGGEIVGQQAQLAVAGGSEGEALEEFGERGYDGGISQLEVVLKAGERDVANPQDVVEAVKTAREAGRPSIAFQVERDGARRFIALPLRAA